VPAASVPAASVPAASVPAAETGEEDAELGEPEPRTVVVTAVPAWLNWAPAAVLGVGAVVMAVLLVVFSHGVWWGPDPNQVPAGQSAAVVREHVLAAAKTCVATANTYKYTDLEDYENKALACTTGEFTNQLRDTIEQVIKANAPTQKASQTAQINRGGIEAISQDSKQWTIILFGQLSVTNTNYPKGRTDPFAAQVRMDKVNGKWLMSDLTTVSSPVS
jgi:Mce-associated membrane protein